MKYLLYFFLLSVTVSGLVFTACGQQSTSANKAWVKDEIADSSQKFRDSLTAVRSSINTKLAITDTSALASDAQISALESKKFNTADTTAFNSKTLTTAQLATKFNTADTTAFSSKALAMAQLAYKLDKADTSALASDNDVSALEAKKLDLSGGTMTGNIDMGSQNVTSIKKGIADTMIVGGENIASKINDVNTNLSANISTHSSYISALYDSISAIRELINSFTPIILPLASPTLTSATADDDSALIVLIFSSDASADSTVIQRSTNQSTWTNVDTVNEDVTSLWETTTLGNTLYYYRLYSYNTSTSSGYSSVKSATTIDTTTEEQSKTFESVYYVDASTGNNSNTGTTPGQAWQTVGKVNTATLVSGDTVVFTGGQTWTDDQLDVKDGVVYTSSEVDSRWKLAPNPSSSTSFAIYAFGKSGFTVQDCEVQARNWVDGRESYLGVFDNCKMYFPSATIDAYQSTSNPILFSNSSYWKFEHYATIKNCILIGGFQDTTSTWGELIRFHQARYLLLENNRIQDAPHALLEMDNADNVIQRNNRLYNTYHHAGNPIGQYSYNMLFENNYYEKQGAGCFTCISPDPNAADNEAGGSYMWSYNGIVRWNVYSKSGAYNSTSSNPFPAFDISYGGYNPYTDDYPAPYNNRIYNNTFYNNYSVAFGMAVGADANANAPYDNSNFNNAFVRNGDAISLTVQGSHLDTTHIHIYDYAGSYSASNNTFSYNYLGSIDNSMAYGTTVTYYDANEYSSSDYAFSDNIDSYWARVVFDNPINTGDSLHSTVDWTSGGNDMYDSLAVRYNPTAPLIDAGRPMALVTANASSSQTIEVDDPYCFFDGFGWVDGDSIAVIHSGSPVYARISSKNNGAGTLTLNEAITVSIGDPVYAINPLRPADAYKGSEIDIGAFEDTP